MSHLLIVNGSDAGIMAALRARELSPATEVTVVVADGFPNFSICEICGDQRTGKLLGAQIAGPIDTEVSKRVDIFATAIFHDMLVEDLNDLDLSYTPPLSAPWDAIQAVA
jgi:NADPH-dependent 2,4-dienoyl-CoA reductase/sulfur reductase-like enzyme